MFTRKGFQEDSWKLGPGTKSQGPKGETGQDRLLPSKCPKGELDHTPGNPGVPVQLGRFNLTRLNLQVLEMNRWHWTSREIPRHPMPEPRAGRRVLPEGTRRPAQEQELHPGYGSAPEVQPTQGPGESHPGDNPPKRKSRSSNQEAGDKRSTSTLEHLIAQKGLSHLEAHRGLSRCSRIILG